MFGLEKQKKAKVEEFVFELEQELKSPAAWDKMRTHVEQSMGSIKAALRAGEDKEEFDKFGLLLYGYASLLKVMVRLKNPKKR